MTQPQGQNPTSYLGVKAPNPPTVINAERAPTTGDIGYEKGTIWIDRPNLDVYMLADISAGLGQWTVLGTDVSIPIAVTEGGTGVTSVTANAIVIGDGVNPLDEVGPLTNGQLLIGSTGADPVAAAVIAGTALTSVTGAGSLQFDVDIATDAEAQAESIDTDVLTPGNLAAIRDATNITYTQSPVCQSNANTGVAPTGATGDLNLMYMQEGDIMNQFILGAGQTIIAPRMTASGLLISLDLANNEGAEYNWGVGALAKHTYVIGTSPAFKMDWQFTLGDASGCDPVYIGFRKLAANDAAYTNYTDFAFIGVEESQNSELITIATNLNGAGASYTNTTDAWTDGQTHTLSVLVDAAGVVTFEIDGVAPTATAAFTFDNGDVVIPCFHGLHGAAAPGTWNWVSCFVGLQ